MGLKGRYCVLFLLLALFSLSSLTAARRDDPELKTCKHQCRKQRQYDERQKQKCETQCEEYSREKQGREKGTEEVDEGMEKWPVIPMRDPQEKRESQRCKERCERQSRSKGEMGRSRRYEEEEEGEEERENPYVFSDDEFEIKFQNQFGRERVLPKFTKISNQLKGIENFRVEIFEAKPMTFMLPRHCDADAFIFVADGRGTITLVNPENRESFNIQRGHIMRVPAGTNVYLINRDENRKLILVKLIQSIANPGKFESFFGAGGRNPDSFFKALSPEIVEALFKVPRQELERFFRQQDQGIVRQASKEQIRALSQQGKEGQWPFGGGARTSNGPFNIFRQRPLKSNEFGRLIEVDSDDFKQLRDLEMIVSFANITQGGMSNLHYNTRATKIAVVVRGKGRFQMACPHISSERRERQHRGGSSRHQEQEVSDVHYEKVSGELSCGTVFVVPAGHPFVTIASREENLEIICFEVNAEDNEKVPLAGKKSVFKQLEREAKELSFNEKADEVDEFLEKQEEEFFFQGPRNRSRQDRGGRADE